MMHLKISGNIRALLLPWFIYAALYGAPTEQSGKQSVKLEASSTETRYPQLLNAGTDPTLRFPIARLGHMNATLSFGWLEISRTSIRYQVQQPPGKSQDSFEVAREQSAVSDSPPRMMTSRTFALPVETTNSFKSSGSWRRALKPVSACRIRLTMRCIQRKS